MTLQEDAGRPLVGVLPGQEPGDLDSGHQWHMTTPGSGAVIMVVGGTISVDTADLDAFAAALRAAAESLEQALEHIGVALARMYLGDWFSGIGVARSLLASQGDPSDQAYQASRTECVSCLERLASGPGSLSETVATLRGLAADVSACSETYRLAETGAVPALSSMGPVDLAAFDCALVRTVLGPVSWRASLLARLLTAVGSPLYKLAQDDEDLQAVVQGLGVLLSDPATARWVKDDVVRLALLTRWLSQARTGREAITIQVYLEEVAQRLDPWVSEQLPDRVRQGTQVVDTSSLTPLRRAALHLGAVAAASGSWLFGSQTGISVTPVGGRGSTRVSPPQEDPYGLGSQVGEGLVGQGERCTAPGSIAEVIRHGQEVQGRRHELGQEHEEAGVISIQRVERADGSRSWMVYVPGTTGWTSGNGGPQDLLTNLEAVGGAPTAMDSAVVTAMRQAGIRDDEEVALYGHSQGGITVSNVAADPAVQERFRVTAVLTAGSPAAGADVPECVRVLHLENVGDAVPGLDATPNPVTQHRQTVVIDSREQDDGRYPHRAGSYAQAVEGIEDNEPALREWNEELARVTGAGEEGVRVVEYTFAVERLTTGGFDGLEPTPRPQAAPVDPNG
ncbi:hypothetical protein D4740_01990 [Actinomyces sp. 2119]|nr:hypothetical protein D4740_01990 [Actinomyces sp. 2119]